MESTFTRHALRFVLASAALLIAAAPLQAQPPQSAAEKPGYADPNGVPPRPPAIDIEPVYRKPAIDPIATIRKRGVLRVGVATAEPFVMRDAKGELVGYSIDIARKLADDLGVNVTFVPTTWSQIVPDLLGNYFDVIASGMWVTPGRGVSSAPGTVPPGALPCSGSRPRASRSPLTRRHGSRPSLTGPHCRRASAQVPPNCCAPTWRRA